MNFATNPAVEKQLYPFTLTRSIGAIRIGILTLREKWELAAQGRSLPEIPSHLLPSAGLLNALENGAPIDSSDDLLSIEFPWQIVQLNDRALRDDFVALTRHRTSLPLPPTAQVIGPENVFLEEGARLGFCMLNASTGPIYIGRNAEIMEGVMIRGPFALCEGSVVKMGARIYGATTVGPYSVVGGEIKNSVIFGYSNKAHDGYLGDSVIGEWCNLGGGTTNSNFKNNAGNILMCHPETGVIQNAGQKCGLFMGDYTRSAINTSFNSGTVTGISCNIFSAGLAPRVIPSFTWGITNTPGYSFEKAIRDIGNWMSLKKHSLSQKQIDQLKHIFENLK